MKINTSTRNVIRVFICVIIVGLLAVTVFSLIACNNELSNYKSAKKTEILNYANAKGEDNYSADHWIMINEIVASGNTAIDAAKNQSSVNIAVFETKLAIDGVEPKESDIMKNGAYFVTDTSWEKYVRNCAKSFGENEVWIQDVLNGGDGGERAGRFRLRSSMWTAIHGKFMTVFGNSHRVYQFTPNRGFYTAQYFNSAVSFILNDDILTIYEGSEKIQYKRDNSYEIVEGEPLPTTAPANIVSSNPSGADLNYAALQWNYVSTAGYLGAGVEIRKAGTQDFVPVKVEQVYMNMFIMQFRSSDFLQGVNTVRIYHIGGPILSRNPNQVRIKANSEFVYFSFIVDNDGKLSIQEISE